MAERRGGRQIERPPVWDDPEICFIVPSLFNGLLTFNGLSGGPPESGFNRWLAMQAN